MSNDITHTFSLPITLKGEFLDDVISDVHSGIRYWADYCSDNVWEDKIERDDGASHYERFKVTPRFILTGAERILRPDFKIGDYGREQVLKFVLSGGYEYDSDLIDWVVQAAVFGELVYG